MRIMSRLTLIALILTASGMNAVEPHRDAKADEIAHTMMNAMGGEKAWYAAHFVRFDFKVNVGGKMVEDRSHLWDKMTGRYRLEDKTKDGKLRVVLFNINDRKGETYVDGKKVEGAAGAKAVKDAYEAFINDMYWLAMPWKWLDKGVTLQYLGPQEREAKKYEVVELSFQSVGLTPGDKYRAFIAPDTKIMTHWEYTLQGGQNGAWDWQYAKHGNVMLASNHTNTEGASINMGNVALFDKVDDTFFTDPAKAISQLH